MKDAKQSGSAEETEASFDSQHDEHNVKVIEERNDDQLMHL